MMGSEVHLHVNARARTWCCAFPPLTCPTSTGGGSTYGTQVHFTFRNDLLHLFNPQTEENLLAL